MIGVSGGVDSSYIAYIVKELGLRPLAVHMDNGWNSEEAVKNIRSLCNKLEIDYESYVLDWDEFRDMTFSIKNNISITNFDIAKGIFYEKEGITDMLRVIKPNITLDMVKEIEKKYLEKLL